MGSRFNERSFIEQVASERRCDLKRSSGWDDWILSGTEAGVRWRCVLSPAGMETTSSVEWSAPDVRFDPQRSDVNVRVLARNQGSAFGGYSSTGSLAADVGIAAATGLFGLFKKRKNARAEPADSVEPGDPPEQPRWRIIDPAGVVDDEVMARLESPPVCFHPGRPPEQPLRVDDIHLRLEGLVLTSQRWWDSTPALNYHIDLGIAVARRIQTVRGY
jgi:hypothetical protein